MIFISCNMNSSDCLSNFNFTFFKKFMKFICVVLILFALCTRFLTGMRYPVFKKPLLRCFISSYSAVLFSSYTAQLQASQVSIELMEKSNRLMELEDILSTRDKEIKELHSKLHEVVCMLPVQHSCSMNNA